jgi:hypothetical protein
MTPQTTFNSIYCSRHRVASINILPPQTKLAHLVQVGQHSPGTCALHSVSIHENRPTENYTVCEIKSCN